VRVFVSVDEGAAAERLIEQGLGLTIAIFGYLLVLRWGVWSWLSAAAVAPILFDPYATVAAQLVPADFALVLLVVVVTTALAWSARRRPSLLLVAGLSLVGLVGYGAVADGASATPVDVLSTRGVSLICGLVVGLSGAFGIGRARRSGLQRVCLLTCAPACVVLSADAIRGSLDAQTLLLALALSPMAAALGITAMLRGRRGVQASRPQIDDCDRAAITAFEEEYGDTTLNPVVVVMAAYNEAAGLPGVLESMPSQVCGLPVDVVVVDDGSTDGTTDALHGRDDVFVAVASANRGQGAALRLGYRLARDRGATYIITTDADGQYHPGDFPAVLRPILEDRADFVTGSRLRGHQETRDRFRRTGVHVFAWIVTAMTGHWTTDTSFGLRAMRAEVTGVVTLNEPQYQSSELLLGVHSHGFRVAEVPGKMRIRAAGASKKGRNLVYGSRYARVVFGTWWREGCPAPARDRAAALVMPDGD
jgi:hypothetical protein